MATDPTSTAEAATTTFDLWKVAVPAIAGLLGVMIGGSIQAFTAFFVANRQREHRLEDEQAERDRQDAKLEADRKFLRATLARHLEAYARSCAQAMWANDDYEEQGATNPPDFPAWPADVPWELLGANEMVTIRDIEIRVDIQREQVKGEVWHGAADEDDARSFYMDGAARIGLEAWQVSQELRRKAGVDPFEFPKGGGNFAESLADHVARLDEKAREYEERRAAKAAAGKDELDD